MNKKLVYLSTLAFTLLTGCLTLSNISSAEADPQKEAERVVQNFVDLLANEEYEKAAALVDDPRFATEEEQIQAYRENEHSDEKLEGFQIVSVDVKNDKKVEVDVVHYKSSRYSASDITNREKGETMEDCFQESQGIQPSLTRDTF